MNIAKNSSIDTHDLAVIWYAGISKAAVDVGVDRLGVVR